MDNFRLGAKLVEDFGLGAVIGSGLNRNGFGVSESQKRETLQSDEIFLRLPKTLDLKQLRSYTLSPVPLPQAKRLRRKRGWLFDDGLPPMKKAAQRCGQDHHVFKTSSL